MAKRDNTLKKLLILFVAIIAFIIVLVVRLFVVTKDFRVSHRFDRKVYNLITDNDFSGEIIIAKEGKIYYHKAMGTYKEDGELKSLTSDVGLPIAQLTKTVTAAAILELESDGKLSVDDKLNKYLPEYEDENETAIRDLLNMTTENRGNDKADISVETNRGYIILGELIEKVTGVEYYDYVSEEFFKPLGMYNTGMINQSMLGTFKDDGEHKEYEYGDTYSAKGLATSAVDMYKWQRALYSGEMSFDITKALDSVDYSCGLSKEGSTYISKGQLRYCSSYMQYNTENDEQIIVLCNNDESNATEVAVEAMKLFEEYLKDIE